MDFSEYQIGRIRDEEIQEEGFSSGFIHYRRGKRHFTEFGRNAGRV